MRVSARCAWRTARTRCIAAPSRGSSTASILTAPRARPRPSRLSRCAGALGEMLGALGERANGACCGRSVGARRRAVAYASHDALQDAAETEEIVGGVVVHVRPFGPSGALHVQVDILVDRRN